MHAESFQSWVANSGTQTRSIRVHSLPMCVDLDKRERETERERGKIQVERVGKGEVKYIEGGEH